MEEVKLSAGEKLILLMLCDVYDHLKVKGETETKLIKEAIFSGNLWGLGWQMTGVFQGSETPPEVVSETVHVLGMWQRLEQSFKNLKSSDKEWLARAAEPFGEDVRFHGFDGNNEGNHISAAHFLVDYLDRFQEFKGRDLNAHMPTLEAYRRMLNVFEPILQQVTNRDFSAAQIAEVLKAWRHPSHR